MAVATTMRPRLKWLKGVLSLLLNRQTGLALLERIHASDLSDADRARISYMRHTMLRLPEDRRHAPSSPDAPAPSVHASRRRQRDTS
jgi:hypothetical protein